MNFLDLLKIEFMKVRRSKIIPLIFIAPLLVVISGVASLSNYFTPEYTNAWPAMFIQSALVYAYYLLPFSITPSFILAMFSLLMMPTLKSAKGIWRASTSDRANRPSRSTNSTPRSLAACDWERL